MTQPQSPNTSATAPSPSAGCVTCAWYRAALARATSEHSRWIIMQCHVAHEVESHIHETFAVALIDWFGDGYAPDPEPLS